jgi:hypothetical protein
MFTPSAPSRFIIKQQPQAGCLSTLETTHELLVALEKSGLDAYPLPAQLHDLFARMQAYQIRCASDPALAGYRRRAYRTPAERVLTPIRRRYIPTPIEAPSPTTSAPPPLTV